MKRIERLDADRAAAAFSAAQQSMTGEAYDALALTYVSNQFVAALNGQVTVADARERARAVVNNIRHSDFGRLQLAALTMLNFERAEVPIEQWWSTLRPYLTGLASADFAHHLPACVADYTRAYLALGFSRATAHQLAATRGNAHYTIVQYIVDRLTRVADAAASGGDPVAADNCRAVVRRFLQQWVVASGPPTLRLLAADLLAEQLREHDPKLATQLAEWRAACIAARAAAGTPLALVSPSREPIGDTAGHAAILYRITVGLTLLGAVIATGGVALAAGLLATLLGGAPCRRGLVLGGILSGALIAAAVLWPHLAPTAQMHDLQRAAIAEVGPPFHPWIAGGITTMALAFTLALPAVGGWRTRLARLASAASLGSIVLGLALNLGVTWAHSGLRDYRDTVARHLEQVERVIPPGDTAALDALRNAAG